MYINYNMYIMKNDSNGKIKFGAYMFHVSGNVLIIINIEHYNYRSMITFYDRQYNGLINTGRYDVLINKF